MIDLAGLIDDCYAGKTFSTSHTICTLDELLKKTPNDSESTSYETLKTKIIRESHMKMLEERKTRNRLYNDLNLYDEFAEIKPNSPEPNTKNIETITDNITEKTENETKNTTKKKTNTLTHILNETKNYLIDTSAGWIYFTPVMAASEYFISGMNGQEILTARLTAIAIQTATIRPYAKFREYFAKVCHADKDSSPAKKYLVDTAANIIVQLPIYSTILYASGASSKEIAVALPSGLAVGAVFGRGFGYFLDRWRKIYGRKAVLD